ncbi:fas-activated serine/threonine kinase [Eublepharis macularius]|uniref:Fas-activated serine/threonine kinase n=1 Tax=Eublepharis macularius TaxID=481883 RepID=A0AA97L9R5_EUBMA|nr:fas-activated serine/threonine kinase [Eublepharis macularius]
MLRPRRPAELLRRRLPLALPAAAAGLHRPPQAALQGLLERWRARHPPAPGPAAGSAGAPRPGPAGAEAASRARPPGDAALRALFGSPAFCQRRPARRPADWLPGRVDGLSPATVALIAKYLARHRLREPRLLDSLADFLLARVQQLDPKVIQKMVFPFSRTNYRPSNHPELFSQLESVLVQKAAASPLATVNILMSLFQLQHFPLAALHKVFSPVFLGNVTSSPCGLIVRRYLSFLDAAVALEVQQYDGPRLDPQYRVCMFDGALTADEANHKYSYKGLVAEALRQLVGEDGFRQNEVLPPGYCADFLLWISHSGSVLPLRQVSQPSQAVSPPETPYFQTLSLATLQASLSRQQRLSSSILVPEETPQLPTPQGCGCCPGEEPSTTTALPSSPFTMGSSPTGSLCSTAEAAPHFSPPTQGIGPQQHLPKEGHLLPAAPVGSPCLPSSAGAVPDGTQKAQGIHRVVLSVNDEWHYCQSSSVLVGSRAMRNRHLHLLGYHLVQLPYKDLEKVIGLGGAKQYLCQKLRRLQVNA